MRLSSIAIIASAFAAAAGLSLIAAGFAVTVIEDNSERGVRQALDRAELPWAEVQADGLQLFLHGTAPTEALRFKALSTAGTVVDAARVIDEMQVKDAFHHAPPRFSIEILRNDSGISVIGLVPASTDRDQFLTDLRAAAPGAEVIDLLESADYPTPDGWQAAVDYAVAALEKLPRTKVSVAADAVSVTAISDSAEAKRRLESELARAAPHTLRLALDISAPRPVITPFTLRFLIEGGQARFDACSADTPEARDRILRAATTAGLEGKADCTIGLGVPSPNWAMAVEQSIAAVAELGGGSVTFADADITLVAQQGTDQRLFDRVVGELENRLPDVFALHGVLPKAPDAAPGSVPDFTATLSPEGQVQLRGRVSDELGRATAESFAKARFGSGVVHSAARVDGTLPGDWPVRVLAGLEALSRLSNGAVTVTADLVAVSGNTGNQDASAEIARLLSDRLGEAEQFDINVTYQKKLDPVLGLPTPDECEAEIADILQTRKINFEPGSATPDAQAAGIIDDIAAILKRCDGIAMEIGGHTDSQGREEMNTELSEARAQAVLTELRNRRIMGVTITAKGYGETTPIADNTTEEGREANRRIEFKLIRPKPLETVETTLESVENPALEGVMNEATEVDPIDSTAEQGSNDE